MKIMRAVVLCVPLAVLMWSSPPVVMATSYGTSSQTAASMEVYGWWGGIVSANDCVHGPPACGDGAQEAHVSFADSAVANAVAIPGLGYLQGIVDVYRAGQTGGGFDTRGSANASLRTFWHDLFTITSPGHVLEPGSPVTLNLQVDLVAHLAWPPELDPCSCANVQAMIHALGPDGAVLVSVDMHSPGPGEGPGVISSPNPAFVSISTRVGDTTDLYGELRMSTTVGTNNNNDIYSASVDALNTSHFYIDSATPGAEYVTASGMSYRLPTAVPEPSTAALVVSGLILALGGFAVGRRPAMR